MSDGKILSLNPNAPTGPTRPAPYAPDEWAKVQAELARPDYDQANFPEVFNRMAATIDLQNDLMTKGLEALDRGRLMEIIVANILQGNGGQLVVSGGNMRGCQKSQWSIAIENNFDGRGSVRLTLERPRGKLVLATGLK